MKTLTQKGVGDVPWVSRPGGHLPLPPLLYQRPSVQDVPSSLAGEAFGLPYFKRLTQILFQIQTNFDIRERIGKSHSFEEFRDCVLLLKERSDTNLGHTMVLPSLITSFLDSWSIIPEKRLLRHQRRFKYSTLRWPYSWMSNTSFKIWPQFLTTLIERQNKVQSPYNLFNFPGQNRTKINVIFRK